MQNQACHQQKRKYEQMLENKRRASYPKISYILKGETITPDIDEKEKKGLNL